MTSEAILGQLIGIPSVSGDEQAILAWIERYLQQLGLESQNVGNNVVCLIPGSSHTKALICNGHVDTVAVGNLDAWQSPPFAATVKHGKLYGLGASDMKSGVAIMMQLAAYYSTHMPPIDLWLHFVEQEETTAQGTHAVMEWFAGVHLKQYTETAGVLLEPTSLTCVEIAHKGNIFLQVATQGDSGHGSTPEVVKDHAVKAMFAIVDKLEALVTSWQSEYSDLLLGHPTIALTSITAGDASSPNKIADSCIATFDLRTTPKVHEKALQLIKETLGDSASISTIYDPQPCGYTSEAEAIVDIAKKVTGLPVTSTPGSTDMLFFTALGIPAIIIGPGEKSVEHKANEFVELGKIDKTITHIQAIIEAFGS